MRLPVEPVVVIKPGGSWAALNLRDLWSHRELLYFLVWRDIKVRTNKHSWRKLGNHPTPCHDDRFTYFFGRLASVPTEGVPYPIFFYTGLLVWTYFSKRSDEWVAKSGGQLEPITKVYFPRLSPSAAVGWFV